MRFAWSWVVCASLVALAAGACSDEESGRLFRRELQRVSAQVGGGGETQVITLGAGEIAVEVEIPGNVAPRRTLVQVSLVEGVPRRGRTPVNDRGLWVQPAGLSFDQPVRVRQRVPAPPTDQGYVTVVIPDGGSTFEARGPARRLQPAPQVGGLELWEGDGTGSGLWGLAP